MGALEFADFHENIDLWVIETGGTNQYYSRDGIRVLLIQRIEQRTNRVWELIPLWRLLEAAVELGMRPEEAVGLLGDECVD